MLSRPTRRFACTALPKGDNYTVQELTGKDEMPAGYKLTGRKQGDKNLTEEGDSISGTIASQNSNGTLAEDNKLVFTNSYKTDASDELTPQVTKKVSGTEHGQGVLVHAGCHVGHAGEDRCRRPDGVG